MMFIYKKGFSLAETLVTLAILGVIASIVVPSMTRSHIENRNRVKLKKAITSYDHILNKMVVEHGMKGNTDLDNFDAEDTCQNALDYFKVAESLGNCRFKTSDGVFWDISNIRKPIIALRDQDLNVETVDSNTNRAFYMIGEFDTHGSLRVNDLAYEKDYDLIALQRLYDYISGKTKLSFDNEGISNNQPPCDTICKFKRGDFTQVCENGVTKGCSSKAGAADIISALDRIDEKLNTVIPNLTVYDDNGNPILVTSSDGKTITENHYDESGKLEDYIKSQFSGSGDSVYISKRQEFEPLYAANGTLIKDQELKNKEWRNRDSNGKPTEIFESENTFDAQGNRSTTHKTTNYTSDNKGDIIMINTYSREISPKNSNQTYEVYMSQERKNYQGDMGNGVYKKNYSENYERVKTSEQGNVVYYETTTSGTGYDNNPSQNNFTNGYNKLVQKTKANGDIYYEYYKGCNSSFTNCNQTATECRQQNLQGKITCP